MPTGDRKLDEFESLFRSAIKDVFHFDPPQLKRGIVVTDLDRAGSTALEAQVKRFLQTIDSASEMVWSDLAREDWADPRPGDPIANLLELIRTQQPDLIVTYRHLLGSNRDQPYSLGSVVDTLSQALNIPLLLLPPPDRPDFDALLGALIKVMVVTDHLTGNDELVNWGVQFAPDGGTLYLVHVEDDAALERYLDVLGKLRQIDSEQARRQIPAKLMELPTDYINTIVEVLQQNQVQERVVPVVRMGHALTDYQALMTEHDIDLLILSGRDETQQAMHGMAHAIAVEVRHCPLLLL